MLNSCQFPALDTLRARQGSKWWRYAAEVLPFTPAESDLSPCGHVQDALQDLVERQAYGYPRKDDAGPVAAIKAAFSGHAQRSYGWTVDPDDLLVLPATSQAIVGGIRAFSNPSETVLIQTPAYPGFFKMISAAGRLAAIDPLLSTDDGPSLNTLLPISVLSPQSSIWLLCYPHNPTGRVFTRTELATRAHEAARLSRTVISDELHADLYLNGSKHVPFVLQFPELAPRTITVHSPTKVFGLAGLGGAIVHFGSKEMLERFNRVNPPDLLGSPNVASLVAGAAAWNHGATWRDELVEVVRRNRDHFHDRIAEVIPGIRVHKAESTYFIWADFTELKLPESPARYLLENSRIGAGDGADFGPESANYVRFVSACSPETWGTLLDRLAACGRTIERF